jgi:hypothetical protein
MSIPGVGSLGGTPTVDALDCVSAGNCVAGGGVTVASNDQHAFVVDEVDGKWGKAEQLPGTSSLGRSDNAVVQSLSCSSLGNCSAAGSYVGDALGCQSLFGCAQAFVAREVAGRWLGAIAVPDIANVTNESATYGFLSCSANGACDGVGVDGQQNFAFGEREVAGTWGPGTKLSLASLPGYQPGNQVAFTSLSCWVPGGCTASGSYMNGAPQPGGFTYDPFIVNEVDGSWGAATTIQGAIYAMSCPSSGSCAAIGGDVVVDEVGGVWQPPDTIQGLGNDAVMSDAISCAAPGECSAIVAETPSSYVVNEVDGAWQPAARLHLGPSLGGMHSYSILTGISCASVSSCSAIGMAQIEGSNNEQTMYETYGPDGPALSRVTPDTGSSSGRFQVTLYGSDLAPAPIVLFGGQRATNVVLLNDGAIRATVPSGAGVVKVRVITPWGTSSGIRFVYRR